MNFNNYLTSLSVTTLNLSTSLAYGYGDLATTEINNLKELLFKAEEMIPVLETEACMAEAEELDREEQSFNYWMTMLYGNENDCSPVEARRSSKTDRLKRRKVNKKCHDSDRRHGKPVPQSDKKYWDEQSGTFYRWDEKRKTFDSHKKPIVHRNRKTKFDRLESAMDAKEKEYARFFTGFGELLEDIKYLEDRIRIYEEDIQDLEYEKAFGYLTEEGEEFLEDYKKELEDLRKYKEYKEILLRTI